MNKELEALRGIISKFNDMRVSLESFYKFTQNVEPYIPDIDKEIIVIENAIKRLEEINKLPKTEFYTTNKVELNNESDKKFKALEIIEGKPLTFHLISKCADYDEYLFVVSRIIDAYQFGYVYSKEEFDLLKEVLTNE